MEVSTMRRFWPSRRGEKEAAPAADTARHDDRFSGLRPMHIDPDDDRPTGQDKEAEQAARRAGGSGGGPAFL